MTDQTQQVGLVGLGTMGRGLGHALARAGLSVQACEPLSGEDLIVPDGVALAGDLTAMVAALTPPRRVLLMVTAGDPVDAMIEQLTPLLDPNDILLDGGNSHFRDTERRAAALADRSIRYLGVGISGGEKGAREGASIMAGGPADGFDEARDILEALAAEDGAALCCAHMGPGGAGHFVKMVHNGIEYAIMQSIAEAWFLLRGLAGLDEPAIARHFRGWNEGALASALMEIAATVLETSDPETGAPILDVIHDAADQTGTGRWMVTEAMELGVPVPTIAEAVAARSLSGSSEARAALGAARDKPVDMGDDGLIAAIGDALLGSIVCAYAQGFATIRAAAARYDWPVQGATVARIWRKGCIIQSRLLEPIAEAYDRNPDLAVLLQDEAIATLITDAEEGWRDTVASAVLAGLPVPAMASALAYLDALRSDRLWTTLTQAQRDLFGAHTYRRTDRPGRFHTNWPERE
ncbi:MAG: NADP-dependent phosphogluconate dehydrogenase [Proteobacteria bacterium]|nr:NADP-dependent phosphogluconate dehydrogenase [Pseudomonadota bacterium]MDA1323796.1 NADP-dependent phosphogluconate dehydrogenase [Pseudomonadota bacterium]